MERQQSFFFLYGTAKCGTTWLSKNLRQSSQFYDAGQKEWRLWPSHLANAGGKSEIVNKHERNINRNTALYDLLKAYPQPDQSALKNIRTQSANIEKKHLRQQNSDAFLSDAIKYCRNDSRIITLADMTPNTGLTLKLDKINRIQCFFRKHGMNTKSIWIIRDPLSRAISALKMKLTNQRFGIPATGGDKDPDGTIPKRISMLNLEERLEDVLKFSRYDRFWGKYASLEMPKEVYFYEDFFTQSQLSRVTNFLGMDEVMLMPDAVNQGQEILVDSAVKTSLAKLLEPTYDYVAELYGWKNLPQQWRASYLKIRH